MTIRGRIPMIDLQPGHGEDDNARPAWAWLRGGRGLKGSRDQGHRSGNGQLSHPPPAPARFKVAQMKTHVKQAQSQGKGSKLRG